MAITACPVSCSPDSMSRAELCGARHENLERTVRCSHARDRNHLDQQQEHRIPSRLEVPRLTNTDDLMWGCIGKTSLRQSFIKLTTRAASPPAHAPKLRGCRKRDPCDTKASQVARAHVQNARHPHNQRSLFHSQQTQKPAPHITWPSRTWRPSTQFSPISQ